MFKKVRRPCPICMGDTGDVLHHQRFVIPDRYRLPDSYDVVSCKRCGFVYADTPARQEDYDRYYKECSIYEDVELASGGGATEWDARRLDRTAADIERILSDKNAAIVDLGCANGGLLMALKDRGFLNVTGIDPSPTCVAHVGNQGIRCFVGGLFANEPNWFSAIGGPFDCVILCHVLEHVLDLKTALENVMQLVKTNGILYIEVPNASRYADCPVAPYYYFDCEHINHFEGISMSNLLGQYGCRPIESREKEIQVSDSVAYPAVYCAFVKTDRRLIFIAPVPDLKSRQSILAHIEISYRGSGTKTLEDLARNQTEIIVWGAGSHTLRLLGNTPLGKCNIAGFVDKDSKKQGLKIMDIPVRSPAFLRSFTGPVVICSALHSQEILRELRGMECKNEAIVL
ncbi:MAG: hypothetical protein A2W25_12615 [candidate division Zixibacteria bacterium RBG_16_53_22]|nr:MAG: hypothetical protein A2W25_12615 [candidate division Zixibacteria bacterium RBG_16_53_22]